MGRLANNRALTVPLTFFVILAGLGYGEQTASSAHGAAMQTLQHYLQLRLHDADWKEYSKFVTWPDEPGWDCRWVVSAVTLNAPVKQAHRVVIPVVYRRLGLYCYDFNFNPEPKQVTIKYELVKRPNGWRVDAPIPDYPDIDCDVLTRSLNAMGINTHETAERRTAAAALARKIMKASDRR